MLYWIADSCSEDFTDITIGNTNKAGTERGPFPDGFPTAPRWDPVTGLGSIDPFVICANKYQDLMKNPTSASDLSVTSTARSVGLCNYLKVVQLPCAHCRYGFVHHPFLMVLTDTIHQWH